jgi:enoyl-CoA hydratase
MAEVNPSALKSLRVDYSDDRRLAEVLLLGPGKGNAMGPDFWRELPEVFSALDADPAVRVVLVRGSGANFSYGLDLPAMAGFLSGAAGGATERTAFLDTITQMQGAIDSVEACRKPVVAAVHGWCIGGGVDLVAACDIRLASADAKFSIREVRVAIVADMGSLQRLPGTIGEAATRRLALTGEDIDATRAAELGLVSDVYAGADTLDEQAKALCRTLSENPPLVVQGVKRVLNAGRDLPRRDALAHVAVWNAAFLASEDLTEAVAAFVERREPRFTGR